MQDLLAFAAGLTLLIAGAEGLVRGASKLALSLGVSPLVVGLTVVAFGTGSPELAVSIGAVLDGRTDVATGNVVGSNILNVLVVLGLSALILPLFVHKQLVRQEVPIMIAASLLLFLLGIDGTLGAAEGALLFGLMLAYTAFLVVQSRRASPPEDAGTKAGGWDAHWAVQIGLVVVGLGALVLGSRWLVGAAVGFAQALGVSDLVIGLTVVAFGTSLPEVAASVAAAAKGERDIAVGNVVGSCTFNILGCLGLASLVSGGAGLALAPSLLSFDLWVMLAAALACLPVFLTGREVARWEGALFLGYYAAYTAYLVLRAQDHAALPMLSSTMLGFVIPLTVVTLGVSVLGRRR